MGRIQTGNTAGDGEEVQNIFKQAVRVDNDQMAADDGLAMDDGCGVGVGGVGGGDFGGDDCDGK